MSFLDKINNIFNKKEDIVDIDVDTMDPIQLKEYRDKLIAEISELDEIKFKCIDKVSKYTHNTYFRDIENIVEEKINYIAANGILSDCGVWYIYDKENFKYRYSKLLIGLRLEVDSKKAKFKWKIYNDDFFSNYNSTDTEIFLFETYEEAESFVYEEYQKLIIQYNSNDLAGNVKEQERLYKSIITAAKDFKFDLPQTIIVENIKMDLANATKRMDEVDTQINNLFKEKHKLNGILIESRKLLEAKKLLNTDSIDDI
jgi:hypothetical protein